MLLRSTTLLVSLIATSTAALADTQAPSVPTGVTAQYKNASAIEVRWNAAGDNVGVAGYNVYRDGRYYKTIYGTLFEDRPAEPGKVHRYTVTAFDDARNYTRHSDDVEARSVDVATRSNGAPTGLNARALDSTTVRLEWNEIPGAAGYNVYRDGRYVKTSSDNDATVGWLSPGTRYRFTVTAFSGDGRYSSQSNEASIVPGQSDADANGDAEQSAAASSGDSSRVPGGHRLVFSDEFDGNSIDAGKWTTRYRWGPQWTINGESQYYVDQLSNPDFGYQPISVGGGNLTITAERTPDWLKSSANYKPYLSGVLTTHGRFTMREGYVEMRAKMPRGRGLWPAFWLLHNDNGGIRPEIDVVEFLGHDVDTVYHTYHYYRNNQSLTSTPSYATNGPDYTAGFHTYGMRWNASEIVWYVDGAEKARYDRENVPRQDMYILLNLALGGGWAGVPDGSTPFPARYVIDYVRAYGP